MKSLHEQAAEIAELAAKATRFQIDQAERIDEDGSYECPLCDGGYVEGSTYTNWENQPIGVQFFGIGEQHKYDEAFHARIHDMVALIAAMDVRIRELEAATEILGLTPETAKAGLERSKANALDAERYRWLRDQTSDDGCVIVMKEKHIPRFVNYTDAIDQYVDAARKEAACENG